MAIVTLGIDLAKNVFAVHGIDEAGKPQLVRPAVRRGKLLELVASLAPCLIGMEACSGASLLGARVREAWPHCAADGTEVRDSLPDGRQARKNDANDAAAICEAVTRPSMRFVPVKSIDQQAELFVHRARQGYVTERTALINRLRGLLTELGIVLPAKAATMRREVHVVLETLPGWCNTVVGDMLNHLERLDERIAQYDRHLTAIARGNAHAKRLMKLSGVGPMTASAIVATVGSGHDFASSRQFSAWLGLTPGPSLNIMYNRLSRVTHPLVRAVR